MPRLRGMIALYVFEELGLHSDREDPADRIGEVLKGFLFRLALRHAARQIDALGDPPAVKLIALS